MKRSSQNIFASNLLRGNSVLLVLATLRDGPTHGGAIAVEIAERTSGTIEVKHGTLYPLLHEMEQDGYVTSEWQIEDKSRPKRVYTITPLGLRELELRLRVWNEFGTALRKVTEGGGDGG